MPVKKRLVAFALALILALSLVSAAQQVSEDSWWLPSWWPSWLPSWLGGDSKADSVAEAQDDEEETEDDDSVLKYIEPIVVIVPGTGTPAILKEPINFSTLSSADAFFMCACKTPVTMRKPGWCFGVDR